MNIREMSTGFWRLEDYYIKSLQKDSYDGQYLYWTEYSKFWFLGNFVDVGYVKSLFGITDEDITYLKLTLG